MRSVHVKPRPDDHSGLLATPLVHHPYRQALCRRPHRAARGWRILSGGDNRCAEFQLRGGRAVMLPAASAASFERELCRISQPILSTTSLSG